MRKANSTCLATLDFSRRYSEILPPEILLSLKGKNEKKKYLLIALYLHKQNFNESHHQCDIACKVVNYFWPDFCYLKSGLNTMLVNREIKISSRLKLSHCFSSFASINTLCVLKLV